MREPAPQRYDDSLYDDVGERPPWIEEAADPTWWDVAMGSYGDGYLEWVTDRYFWEPGDARTLADTRSLWRHRDEFAADTYVGEVVGRVA